MALLTTKETIQSNFCIHIVNPTQSSSISLSSKHDSAFSQWKLKECKLPITLLCKQVRACTQWKRLGQAQHPVNSTVSTSPFCRQQLLLSGKLWPALLTARLQRLIYTLTFISNVFWILCLACFNSALIERNHTFISFRLSCIIRGIKCSQRPAMSLLNSCILVFAVNRSSPIFMNKNEGFG